MNLEISISFTSFFGTFSNSANNFFFFLLGLLTHVTMQHQIFYQEAMLTQ